MGASDCGFSRSSCGYVGTSDGYQDLSPAHGKHGVAVRLRRRSAATSRCDGRNRRSRRNREFTIAIAPRATVTTRRTVGHDADALDAVSPRTPSASSSSGNRAVAVHVSPIRCFASADGGRLIAHQPQPSSSTHEDKTFSGAFIASASIPWGASQGRRRPRRLPPRLDPRHGPVRHRAAGLRTHRNGTPRARLPGLHAASRRRASRRTSGSTAPPTGPASSSTRSHSRSSSRGGCGSWTAWAIFDVFPFVERAAGLPRSLRAGHPAGTLGRKRRLLTLHAGRGHLRAWSARPTSRVPTRRRTSRRASSRPMPTGLKRISTSGRPPRTACCCPASSDTTCASVHRPGRAVPQCHSIQPGLHPPRQPRARRALRTFDAREVVDGRASSSLSVTASAAPTTRSLPRH